MQSFSRGLIATSIVFVSAATAWAADPAVICHTGKLKVAGKYAACRLNAEAKGIKTASTPDYSKCESVFSDKWQSAETKAGMGICVTEGDEAAVEQRTTWHADAVATELTGAVPVDPYSPASGQTTSYGTGSDGDVQAGAALAYRDNGDGTITDLNTGLMWEKKVQFNFGYTQCFDETGTCANPHNADNVYSWSAAGSAYDGRVVTIFLEQLNNRCDQDTTLPCTVDTACAVPGGACGFAGHRDWRLPNMKELQGIIDWNTFSPALDAAFFGASCGPACTDLADPACSCDASSIYWSATTLAGNPSLAWYVSTYVGLVNYYGKTYDLYVRAVRAGS